MTKTEPRGDNCVAFPTSSPPDDTKGVEPDSGGNVEEKDGGDVAESSGTDA